ncbi:hypothetical protein GRI99_07295 [Altererythrobacter buctensis]|uniref:DUF4105 domain-containing protein n=1 Tax=Alteraurantiacibacter buctensis TaxID=1503981 RepID=A0A844YWM2_9SPHN|nr:hypothetical protein [Alteraurantiacibacter buctensis]
MLLLASPALAQVTIHFHSFNGSVLFGRFPHTFVVFEGTLEATGERIDENFGFGAASVTAAASRGPARHVIYSEEARQVSRTNRHFSMPLTDAQYRTLRAEVETWRNQPSRYHELDRCNCIHFVARLAQLLGLRADVPHDLVRRPRTWLNQVVRLNPHVGGREFE